MNDMNPNKPIDDGTPDAFERAWMDALAKPDPELEATRKPFVASVLESYRAEQAGPAIVGRIGIAWMPYAAAAAIVLAGAVGWLVLKQDATPSSVPDLAHQPDSVSPDIPPQPAPDVAVLRDDAARVPLGKLIAQTRSTMTAPANDLTAVVRDTPENLRVRRLLDLIDNPVPDLKELLAPLDMTGDPQQIRA